MCNVLMSKQQVPYSATHSSWMELTIQKYRNKTKLYNGSVNRLRLDIFFIRLQMPHHGAAGPNLNDT